MTSRFATAKSVTLLYHVIFYAKHLSKNCTCSLTQLVSVCYRKVEIWKYATCHKCKVLTVQSKFLWEVNCRLFTEVRRKAPGFQTSVARSSSTYISLTFMFKHSKNQSNAPLFPECCVCATWFWSNFCCWSFAQNLVFHSFKARNAVSPSACQQLPESKCHLGWVADGDNDSLWHP